MSFKVNIWSPIFRARAYEQQAWKIHLSLGRSRWLFAACSTKGKTSIRSRMVRKLDLLELTLVDRHTSELAIMTERQEESARSFRFVLIALAGWMNHRQYQVI